MPNYGAVLLPYPSANAVPDVPADMQLLVQRLAALMDPTPTIATLPAVGDFVGQTRNVTNVPGALFTWNGASWVMYGTARFADNTARGNAITAPVAGMLTYLASTGLTYERVGTQWVPLLKTKYIRPTSTAVAGGTATINDDGSIAAAAVATGAFDIKGIFTDATADYKITIVAPAGAPAVDYTIQLLDASGNPITTAASYNQFGYFTQGTTMSPTSVNAAQWAPTFGGNIATHRSVMELGRPNAAQQTPMTSRGADAGLTASGGYTSQLSGIQTTAAAMTGVRLNITSNPFTGLVMIERL